MTNTNWIKPLMLVGLLASMTGCIIAPGPRYHDGYWDHEHSRYWQGGGWHPCSEHGEYCR